MRSLIRFFKSDIFILIVLSYFFSIICRLVWVYLAQNIPEFMWNNQIMINTNDGYAFAEGARDMIAGFHQPNDLSYYGVPLSTVTYLLDKILPFSFETIILYLSVFFSSLIVVPILLIGKELQCLKASFIAALSASIANSYYNRTMAGYYDTDMLTIVLPMFIFWGLIRLGIKKDNFSFLIIAFSMLAYSWWYPSSFSLNSCTAIFFLLYTLIFDRKNILNYLAILFMLLSLSGIEYFIRILLILALFLFIKFRPNLITRNIVLGLAVIILAIFIFFGGLDPIWFQLKFYVFRGVSDSFGDTFKYYNVNQTIMESSGLDFEQFASRISGNEIIFLLSLIGYIILCIKNKIFLVTLPMLGLGFLSVKAGLRFTIYAVPLLAFGFGFFLTYIMKFVQINKAYRRPLLVVTVILTFLPFIYVSYFVIKNKIIISDNISTIAFLICIIAYLIVYIKFRRDILTMFLFPLTFFGLISPLIHINEYKPGTVFLKPEVEILDKLKKIAGREDYVLTWWDYGYIVRYYSDVKTLIDGGKHLGKDNFGVSFSLSKPELSSANMARLDVEYTEKSYKDKFDSNLVQMLKDYNYTNINSFLLDLNNEKFKLPHKTRDIYYFLPERMMNIFPVVVDFSNLDLNSGKEYQQPLFAISRRFEQKDNSIFLDNGIIISDDMTNIIIENKSYRVHAFIQTSYDQNGKLQKVIHQIDNDGLFYVIYMKDYNRFLILDKNAFNSTYIQLFVLENYDKNLFEPVILSPYAKVYRLRR